jgi:hypothetical protein
MNQSVVSPLKHKAERFTRWLICIIPLIFSGCFNSQSALEKPKSATRIAALSRFFPSGNSVSERTSDSNGISEIAAFMPGSASSLDNIADEYPELVAVPDFLGSKQNAFQNASKLRTSSRTGLESGNTAYRKTSSFSALAALVFNGSFNQVFSSLFKKPNEDSLAVKDDIPNPFTEAKQKEAASPPENKPVQVEKPVVKDQNTAKEQTTALDSKPQSTVTAPMVSAGGNGVSEYALVIGDFNGSGMLAFSKAARVGDTRFVSTDGEREFELSVNSNAVELRSSFCVDDLNGDGYPDLLATNWSLPFGAVLLGDANNRFRLSDTFYTGFEATVPSVGPFRDGKREILTVDMRSGEVHVFRATDRYYEMQRASFPFVPDYLLHLIESDSSTDFLLTAQANGAKQLLGWNDDGTIGPSSEVFAANPIMLTADIGADSVQGYQVGNYASIVLTNHDGSFNVANMSLFPKVFLVIGDLERNGTTDVAIGNLKSFTPAR